MTHRVVCPTVSQWEVSQVLTAFQTSCHMGQCRDTVAMEFYVSQTVCRSADDLEPRQIPDLIIWKVQLHQWTETKHSCENMHAQFANPNNISLDPLHNEFGGVYWFHSIHLSVHMSCMPSLLCGSLLFFSWIIFICGTNITHQGMMCWNTNMAAWLYLGNKSFRDNLCLINMGRSNPSSWEWHSDFFFINWQAVKHSNNCLTKIGITHK